MVSCGLQSSPLPDAKGKAGEIIVVLDRHTWEGACGDTIRHCLSGPMPALPQAEPMFTLIQQDALSGLMEQFRNILIVDIDNGYEFGSIVYKTDAWAKNQLVFNVKAPSADSVIAVVKRNRDMLLSQYLAKDRDSYINLYKKIIDESIVARLKEKFDVEVIVPKEYKLDVERDNFVWMAREEGEMIMGLLMWKDPYSSEDQLTTDRIIARMNEVTKANVPGPVPGSYMADEPQVAPVVKKFRKDGVYCTQINGLWQTENGFMGGPYVNFTVVDEKKSQLVTGMGFVFYPRKPKRNYVRQLEAILYTMTPLSAISQPQQ